MPFVWEQVECFTNLNSCIDVSNVCVLFGICVMCDVTNQKILLHFKLTINMLKFKFTMMEIKEKIKVNFVSSCFPIKTCCILIVIV